MTYTKPKQGPRAAGARTRRGRQSGHAALEMALVAPWIFFLFAGTFDWGFYSYGLVATQNAARVAALYTSAKNAQVADSTTACTYALHELKDAPGVGSGVTTCSDYPVKVTATSVTGADNGTATSVTVSYRSVQLIPIPGLLTGRMTTSRTVQMRVRS